MSIEIMKQALEYVAQLARTFGPETDAAKVAEALRAAIEQAEKQEPVAWIYEVNGAHTCLDLLEPPDDAYDEGTLHPLYTTPPAAPVQEPKQMNGKQPPASWNTPAAQRQWVGLTDEERNKLWRDVVGWGDPSHDDEDLMKAIEAKLRELNRGQA